MSEFDYIILGITAVLFVIGLIKGFVKQILAIGLVFVVPVFGSVLTPYLQQWEFISNLITDVNTKGIVCMVFSYVIITIAYILLSNLISKIVNKTKVVGKVNRLLGGFIGILVVYLVMSVVCVIVMGVDDYVMFKGLNESLAETFNNSWIYTNIFAGDKNFFGNWVMKSVIDTILEALPQVV